MKKGLFTALQWTWGLPQTLIGSALYMAHRKKRHFNFNGVCATVWDRDDAVSLGKFIFVPRMNAKEREDGRVEVSKEVTEHEFGHSLQSLILGPAYLLVVGAPSLIWNRLPYFQRKRVKTGKSYYAPVFEKTANKLAQRKKND